MSKKNVEQNAPNNEASNKDTLIGCVTILAIIVGIFFFFKSCVGCGSDSNSESNNGNNGWPRECVECGKIYDKDDTYYGKIYLHDSYEYHGSSSNRCAKCSFEYADRAERAFFKKQRENIFKNSRMR